MCGVFGYIGRPTKKTIRVIRQLGLLNRVRGKDSTGLVVSNGSEYSLLKEAVDSHQFFADPDVSGLLHKYKRSPFIMVIGHTRAATRGAVTSENAHPFESKKFVFAHNGVIMNFDHLQWQAKTEFEVDSQIVGHLLDGNEETEVFQNMITGWATVPYFSFSDMTTLKIAKRNAPLALGVLADKSGVFFSSDQEHLQKALKQSGIGGVPVGDTQGSRLYTFHWDGSKVLREKTDLIPSFTYARPEQHSPYWEHADTNQHYRGGRFNSSDKALVDGIIAERRLLTPAAPRFGGARDFDLDDRYETVDPHTGLLNQQLLGDEIDEEAHEPVYPARIEWLLSRDLHELTEEQYVELDNYFSERYGPESADDLLAEALTPLE